MGALDCFWWDHIDSSAAHYDVQGAHWRLNREGVIVSMPPQKRSTSIYAKLTRAQFEERAWAMLLLAAAQKEPIRHTEVADYFRSLDIPFAHTLHMDDLTLAVSAQEFVGVYSFQGKPDEERRIEGGLLLHNALGVVRVWTWPNAWHRIQEDTL